MNYQAAFLHDLPSVITPGAINFVNRKSGYRQRFCAASASSPSSPLQIVVELRQMRKLFRQIKLHTIALARGE
jgi:hypothetical protein